MSERGPTPRRHAGEGWADKLVGPPRTRSQVIVIDLAALAVVVAGLYAFAGEEWAHGGAVGAGAVAVVDILTDAFAFRWWVAFLVTMALVAASAFLLSLLGYWPA